MTQKQSQLVLPINATTLFTTVIGAIIVAAIFLFASVPNNVRKLLENADEQAIQLHELAKSNLDHGQRIQAIENTRFDARAAERLAQDISKEMRLMVEPLVNNTERNERRIDLLDMNLRDMQKEQKQ